MALSGAAEAAPVAEALAVRRRRVFYVPGYDARRLRSYRTLFRAGLAGLGKLYGIRTAQARAGHGRNGGIVQWTATAEAADWRVDTVYDFLSWDDIVRRDLERPIWWKTARGLSTYAHLVFSGTLPRIFRHTWRCGAFLAYPGVVLLAFLAVAGLAGWGAGVLATWSGMPLWLSMPLGAAFALAAFAGLFGTLGRRWFVDYLIVDGIATVDYAAGRRPDWEARIAALAGEVAAAAGSGDYDEVLVVGHSSGSFIAVDVVDRAMRAEPEGRFSLLTVGSILPMVGFLPKAGWFRDALARLAVAPGLTWVEFHSRKDIMSMSRFDPVTGHGIELGEARLNPTVFQARFREMLEPGTYDGLALRFFRLHFLFLAAAERPAFYDYHLMVMGRLPLALRAVTSGRVERPRGEEAVALALGERRAMRRKR